MGSPPTFSHRHQIHHSPRGLWGTPRIKAEICRDPMPVINDLRRHALAHFANELFRCSLAKTSSLPGLLLPKAMHAVWKKGVPTTPPSARESSHLATHSLPWLWKSSSSFCTIFPAPPPSSQTITSPCSQQQQKSGLLLQFPTL